MTAIIEVKNISKKYNINHQRGGYIALRDVLANIFKNPFSFAKDKVKIATGMKSKEEFWALKNVSFNIEPGEVVGIIGANGAGKSTLLKILTGITPPTEGEIILKGKVGSLLEVGTGFHPELTGRENIFLNGAILGMKKKEIAKKFDEIVEFSGIEKFLDTPVKYYSSGMYVRLAFSVAAHMEPDILLVDEVLAVGDMEFQKKCLGKMEEITNKRGRTILFVSHNMSAIQNLCKKTVVLNNGQIVFIGNTSEAINHYLSVNINNKSLINYDDNPSMPASILSVSLNNSSNDLRTEFSISEEIKIKIEVNCHNNIENATLSTIIYSEDRSILLYSSQSDTSGKLSNYSPGLYDFEIKIPSFLLNIGRYSFDIILHNPNIALFAEARDIGFEIKNTDNPRSIIFQGNHLGRIATQLNYKMTNTNNK